MSDCFRKSYEQELIITSDRASTANSLYHAFDFYRPKQATLTDGCCRKWSQRKHGETIPTIEVEITTAGWTSEKSSALLESELYAMCWSLSVIHVDCAISDST